MPTGYTAAVADGTITELEPFAMQLARGMGALVTMRDEPHDAPIPERFEPSPYYAESLAKARAKLDELTGMTDDEAEGAAEAEHVEATKAYAEAKAEHEAQRQRYNDMIAKVEAWQGAPEGIKKFALDQLTESREFDCREPFRFWRSTERMSGAAWRARALEEAAKSHAYAAKANAEEIERTEKRNRWLAQLRQSLRG